jgi:hypothetical protein
MLEVYVRISEVYIVAPRALLFMLGYDFTSKPIPPTSSPELARGLSGFA